MSEHADLEALSAFVDGEAPEWAGHVAGCDACRAAAEGLRTVAAAVGAPIEPAAEADRERALAAALGQLGGPATGVEDPRFARRRQRRTWNPAAVASVAAVLLVGILGISALVAGNTGSSSDQTTTAAGPAPESVTRDLAGGAAPEAPATDLGDVPDAATLVSRARATGVSAGATVQDGASGGGASGASGAAPAQPPVVGGQPFAARSSVPRPCEKEVRAREPALREVVFVATARRGGVPAIVLGFSTGPPPSPVTLLMLAQEGCAELLRAAAP